MKGPGRRRFPELVGRVLLVALLAAAYPAPQAATPVDPCRLTLRDPARMVDHSVSPALLAKTFARKDLAQGIVDVGEGETREGTLVFPDDPRRRLQIVWGTQGGVHPKTWLIVEGESRWRGYQDIGLATDLRTLERLNGRPFVLSGFHADNGGTVLDWGGGRFAPTASERCHLIVRLEPSPGAPSHLVDQVAGGRDVPSDHAAMQTLNPLVYQIILELP